MADERKERRRILRLQHLGPNGKPLPQNWRPGIGDLEDTEFRGAGLWRQIGPAPLDVHREQLVNGLGPAAGEVLDVAFDPGGGDSPRLYIATNGGVWRSDDGGLAWMPLTDMIPASAIGAVAVDPSDTTVVYAGTRNLVDGSGIVPRALGVWRSDDEGKTWAPLDGGPDVTVLGEGVNCMVCPAPDVLLVGCTNGLFLSVDGGLHFGANAPAFDDLRPVREGNICALAVDSGFRAIRRVEGTTAAGGAAIVVECKAHGFGSTDTVSIGSAADANANGTFEIEVVDDNHFKLVDSSSAATGGPGGFVVGPNHPSVLAVTGATKSSKSTVVIKAVGHGLVTGDIVVVTGVGGVAAANGSWVVNVLTDDTFELVGSKMSGTFTSGGRVEAPKHGAARPIVSATNVGDGVELEVTGHAFLDGDRVSARGLPGIDVKAGAGTVRIVPTSPTDPAAHPNKFVLKGLKMNAAYQGGGTALGPAAAWNMAYVAVAGRKADGSAAQKTKGLFRLTLASDTQRQIAISGDLIAKLTGGYDRLRFAQATEPRSRILYLATQTTHPETKFLDVLRSDDFGGAWRSVSTKALKDNLKKDGTGASDEAFTLGVDPRDPRRVYLGMKQLWVSTDGGTAWPAATIQNEGGDLRESLKDHAHSPSTGKLHHGHHAMAFLPPTHWPASSPPTPLFFGTAGGVARTDDGAATFVHLNHGLAISLATAVDVGRSSPDNNAITFAATHQGGIAGTRGSAGYPWRQGLAGDGAQVAIHPAQPERVFGFVDGQFVRTARAGEDWQRPTTRRPIVTHVLNFEKVQINTLGHLFKPQQVLIVSEVRSGGTEVKAVNGSHTALSDDGAIIVLRDVSGTPPPSFDRVATAFSNRFLREIAIVKVTSGAPIRVETSMPHGVTGSSTPVRVEGVRSVPGANNTGSNVMWTATRVSDTVLSLDGSTAPVLPERLETAGRIRIADGSGEAAIQHATNTNPIVVVAVNHGFVTGQAVTISFVRGNTAANVVDKPITVVDRNTFQIDNVAGNGPFDPQPAVEGTPGSSLNLSSRTERQRLVVAPGTDDGTFIILASVRDTLFISENLGASFISFKAFTGEDVSALNVSDSGQIWVGLSGSGARAGTLRRSTTTRILTLWHPSGPGDTFVADVGARGSISAIAFEPGNSSHVAVAVSGYSNLQPIRGTHHVFLTKSAGFSGSMVTPAWEEARSPLSIGSHLPDLPVHAAMFVKMPNDPVLLIGSDGGVLRFSTGRDWIRVGPNLPTISCQALAVDNSSNAPGDTVRVATYGRGVWQLEHPQDARLVVRASLGFGHRPQNKPATLPLVLHNVGNDAFTVTGVDVTPDIGPGDFTVSPAPTSAMISGDRVQLTVSFTPSTLGFQSATITIRTTAPGQAEVKMAATGTGVPPGTPRVSVRWRELRFGRVQTSSGATVVLTIRNAGTGDAAIGKVALTAPGSARPDWPIRLFPDLLPPFNLPAGQSTRVEVAVKPAGNGAIKDTIRIESTPVGAATPKHVLDVAVLAEGTTKSGTVLASLMHSLGLADAPEGTLS